MNILLNIIYFLILIGVVVFCHEGGHYIFCRIGKIKVLEFSLGFGPKLFSKNIGKDQTLFTIRLLPLGGFVRPLDQNSMTHDEWLNVNSEDKLHSIGNTKKIYKILMAFGGPLMNFILAFFVFWIAFSFIGNKETAPIFSEIQSGGVFGESGVREGEMVKKINNKEISTASDAYQIIASNTIEGNDIELETDSNKYLIPLSKINLKELGDDIGKIIGAYLIVSDGDIIIKNITPQMPGEISGLMQGDKLLTVNNEEYHDLGKLLRKIKSSPNNSIAVEVLRDNEKINFDIVPTAENIRGVAVGKIGVEFETVNPKNYTFNKIDMVDGASKSFNKVINSSKTTVISLYKILAGEISPKTISGPISIADYSGRSANKGLYTYLILLGMISIAVGIFNLIPIPILDGGHILIYTVEWLRSKDFTINQLRKLQLVGVLCMIAVFTVAISNDLTKYLG